MDRPKLSDQQLTDIIMMLNGEIEPVGETNTDNIRYDNLIRLQNILDLLLKEMNEVCCYCNRAEYSMSNFGRQAVNWVSETQEWLKSIVDVYKERE